MFGASDKPPAGGNSPSKVIYLRLLKNAQMQGAQNPEE